MATGFLVLDRRPQSRQRFAGAQTAALAQRQTTLQSGSSNAADQVLTDEANRLAQAADLMTQQLGGDRRVRRETYRVEADLAIQAVVSERPFVYGVGP